jgi:hypothetical protein
MTINCTLNALAIPGFSGIDPPFGTQKPAGQSITGREAYENAVMPFRIMRPHVVAENSTTTQIQANCVFEFVTGGISLTLGVAAFAGCRVAVINSSNADATIIFGDTSVIIHAKNSVHLEYVNGTWVVVDDYSDALAFISLALDQAGIANREINKTIKQRIQSGVSLIVNRGVISGCAVTKSSVAIRNISLSGGAFFMNGFEMPCPSFQNAAMVPTNYGETAKICYAYICLDATGAVRFACTPLDGSVPDNGLALYRLSVPAKNTETSDLYLSSVTMTDVRRMEAGYPLQFNSLAYSSVALPYSMLDTDYQVEIEVLSFRGGATQRVMVYPGDKAANGFKIYAEGTLDSVKVRWIAIKANL